MILYHNAEEEKIAKAVVDKMAQHAVNLDGTCELPLIICSSHAEDLRGTGEHGVGVGKKQYLEEELGESTVQLMKQIKQLLDPLNLFNPGKVRVCNSAGLR